MSQAHIIIGGSKTQTGLKSEFNTDAIADFAIADGHVYIVSDGHDGESGHGALAAKICVDSIKKYFHNKTYNNLSNALTNAITFANYAVFELVAKDIKYKGIGATVAVLIIYKNEAYYAYAGDSRIYLNRNGDFRPLTKDHVNEQQEVAVLVGRDKDIKFGVCIKPIELELHDSFLVCTNGLTDALSDDKIASIIKDQDTLADHKALKIADLARAHGHNDALSLHVVEFGSEPTKKQGEKSNLLKSLITILIVIVGATVLGYIGFKGYALLSKTETLDRNEINQEKIPNEKSVVVKLSVEETQEPAQADFESEELGAETVEEVSVEKQIAPVKVQVKNNETLFHQHKVVYGENLYRLGLRYNISQDELIKINGSVAKSLVAGAAIKIPIKGYYTVKSGDSWSVVSDKFNVKIKSIANASKISATEPLQKDQKLIIPLK